MGINSTGIVIGEIGNMIGNISQPEVDIRETSGKTDTERMTEVLKIMNQSQFHILTPSFILACILLVLGVPGNMIAVMVYITKMKRSTAGYFIITLALSDLTNCLVSLPLEMYLITHFMTFDVPWLCKFSRFLTAAMNNTSSFVLVAIAVERFRSICTPLKPRYTSFFSKMICLCIATAAILSALPMVWGYGTFTYTVTVYNVTVHGKTCLVDDGVRHTSYPNFLLIYFFVGHIVVFIVLAFLYICIARKLMLQHKFQNSDMSKSSQSILLQRQNSTYSVLSFSTKHTSIRQQDVDDGRGNPRKVSRTSSSQSTIDLSLSRKHGGHIFRTKRLTCMLFLVTFVFEVSFIPYLVIVSLRNQYPDMYEQMSTGSKMAYQFFLRSYLINCAMNPIIYCFYNQNFRHGVKRLFESIKTLVSARE